MLPWRREQPSAAEAAPLAEGLALTRAVLVFVGALAVGLVLQLALISSIQQRSAQQRAFDRYRGELANGTAPIGPTDTKGRLLAPGSPVAYLEVPSIGIRQVVVEGTSAGALFTGPGHRRDTPLPGQAGVSLIMGRRAAYGGPFAHIGRLEPGAIVHVTTGEGVFDYRVVDVRHAHDRMPAAVKAGSGRLILATAAGRPFVPSDVLWVDADLTVPAIAPSPGRIATGALPASDLPMAADTSTLWTLALWLQALIIVVLAGIWAWHRWGRAKAWIVFLPPLLLVGLEAAGEAAKLLPNLL
jgi:sortase A